MSVIRREGSLEPQKRPEGWASYLDRGETLVWEGAPAGGIRVRPSDIPTSLFGLFFFGFAVFWVLMASSMSGPSTGGAIDWIGSIFPLFGLPFVAIGAYLVAGRFLWGAYVRSQTRYALTNKRAIIARNASGRTLKSYPITADTRLELEPGDLSTIWFAEEIRRGSKGSNYTVKKGFEYITDGEEVYRQMRRVQQEATQ